MLFLTIVGIGKYMYYYLQSPSFFELFNLNKTGIIGGVSIAKVKEILIPLPPIKEQQRIVAQIENYLSNCDSSFIRFAIRCCS